MYESISLYATFKRGSLENTFKFIRPLLWRQIILMMSPIRRKHLICSTDTITTSFVRGNFNVDT